jgi:hypothetical protein
MTKTGSSSEFSEHHQCVERTRNQHIYDEVLTEVVPIVPFVDTIRVEEDTSAALLDVINKDTDEVTPNESIVASIELVLTAPESQLRYRNHTSGKRNSKRTRRSSCHGGIT